jgi:hypothetical protein
MYQEYARIGSRIHLTPCGTVALTAPRRLKEYYSSPANQRPITGSAVSV